MNFLSWRVQNARWRVRQKRVLLLPWPVADIRLPSLHPPRVRNFSYHLGMWAVAMGHRWQYKYHISHTSFVTVVQLYGKSGTTIWKREREREIKERERERERERETGRHYDSEAHHITTRHHGRRLQESNCAYTHRAADAKLPKAYHEAWCLYMSFFTVL